MANKTQLRGINELFSCFLDALHVSSDIIAHHQEHLNCSYSFWFYSRVSLSAVSSLILESSLCLESQVLCPLICSVCSSEVDPLLVYFTGKAWVCLNGYINTQNDNYRALLIPD
jgi:hypothetical protein